MNGMLQLHPRWLGLLTAALFAFAAGPVTAQDAEKKAEDKPAETKPAETKPADAKPAEGPKFKEAIIHLDNPSGIAVHPGTGHVFAVSNQGVFRYVPGKPSKIYLEIEGFPKDIYGKGPMYDIGPLGCTLWGTDKLIVADGSRKDGEELVRVYKVEDAVPGKPRKEDAAEFTLGPIAPNEQTSPKGEGNFYGIAVWKDAIYITSNGDDTKGWILKSAIAEGKPGPLTPTIATKEAVEVDAPIAITVSPDGNNLVVSQGGEVNTPGDSLLTTYDAEGKLVKKYTTGLHDICGLAYSPKGKLYAVDFAWADTTQGGLFELTIDGDACKATKILSLDRPTSLAFDKEGGLYITVFGTGKDTGDKPKGGAIRIEPGL
jgi:glucose/arabinose dehydrogenase